MCHAQSRLAESEERVQELTQAVAMLKVQKVLSTVACQTGDIASAYSSIDQLCVGDAWMLNLHAGSDRLMPQCRMPCRLVTTSLRGCWRCKSSRRSKTRTPLLRRKR